MAKDDAPKKEALPDGALARLVAPGMRHHQARQVIFSADGETVLTTGGDHVVRRWEASSGKLLGTQSYPTDKQKYGDVAASGSYPYLSPDGKTVAVIGFEHLYFFDAATGQELHRVSQNFGRPEQRFNDLIYASSLLNGGRVGAARVGAAFTADGKKFAVLGVTGGFLLFDVAAGKAIKTGLPKKMLGGSVRAALDPTVKQMATVSRRLKDGVTLWDVSGGKVLHTIIPDPPKANYGGHWEMVYSPAGDRLLLVMASGKGGLWNTATGEKGAALPFSEVSEGVSANGFSFSPDGSLLACLTDFDQTILLLDAETMKEVRKLPNTSCWAFQFSSDGKTLAGFGNNAISLWKVADGKPLHNSDHFIDQDNVFWVVYSPDGKCLASGGGDVTAIWDLETKKRRATIRTPMWRKGSVFGLAESVFSTDGKTLFGPVDLGAIKSWNVADGKEIATTFLIADDEKGRNNQIFRLLGVSRDGKRLMATCTLLSAPGGVATENSLVVWDIASGKRLDRTTLPAEYNPIAFSPDGAHITCWKDRNLILYDFAEKQERVISARHRYRDDRRERPLFPRRRAPGDPVFASRRRGRAAEGDRVEHLRNGDRQGSYHAAPGWGHYHF